ncbi:MAG TPA: hypothetical protein VFA04_27720, partial [Bryobacteraceae bacterium]|nr:hypothetical protein [Bryobacteraceae bacterium]
AGLRRESSPRHAFTNFQYLDLPWIHRFRENHISLPHAARAKMGAKEDPMATDKQIEASRKNGAKSHGPVTPEGKQRSADNAIKHGLCSRRILLPDESEEELQHLELHWLQQLYPQTAAERDLVMEVVSADWRFRRYQRAESQILELEMEKHAGSPLALGEAFRELAEKSNNTLVLLNRYLVRARREFEKALATYREAAEIRRKQQIVDERVLTNEEFFHKWGRPIQADPDSPPTYYHRELDFLPNEPKLANFFLWDPENPPFGVRP